jgi:hypothetical protein
MVNESVDVSELQRRVALVVDEWRQSEGSSLLIAKDDPLVTVVVTDDSIALEHTPAFRRLLGA